MNEIANFFICLAALAAIWGVLRLIQHRFPRK
jgi:hypothetical protein